MQSYLDLASFAYKDPEQGLFLGAKETSFSTTNYDAQFYRLEFDDRTVFAIRGTSSSEDVMIDAEIILVPFGAESSRVHSGFLKQYKSMQSDIIAFIGTKPCEFVGHSLGGALATIAAAHIKSLFPNLLVKCVTFGSPRVGNAAFAKWFESVDESVRVVNGNDIVTRSPKLFYSHVKGEHRVGSSWWWFASVRDHYLDSYRAGLADRSLKDALRSIVEERA
jgi:pimeloyl-ACP methyl ester carboxylesterase